MSLINHSGANVHVFGLPEAITAYRQHDGSHWLSVTAGPITVQLHGDPATVAERLVVIAAHAIAHLDVDGLHRLAGAAAGLGGQVRHAMGVRGLEDPTGYITPELATALDSTEPRIEDGGHLTDGDGLCTNCGASWPFGRQCPLDQRDRYVRHHAAEVTS